MMKKEFKTLVSFVIYLFLPLLVSYIYLRVFNKPYTKDDINAVIWLNGVLDIVYFIIFVILSIDIFKQSNELIKERKTKISSTISVICMLVVLFYGVKIGSGIITVIISKTLGYETMSVNQSLVESAFKAAPVFSFITGAFLVPVTEELMFRGAVRRIIKNKGLFIAVSGLIFGLVHVLKHDYLVFGILILGYLIDMIIESEMSRGKKIKSIIMSTIMVLIVSVFALHIVSGGLLNLITNINVGELILSINYICAGLYLSFIYVKYDNIYINIAVHGLNNLISYILIFTSL